MHSHEDEHEHDHHHHQEDTVSVEPFMWKMLCATVTVWIFFDLQIILQWIGSIISRRRGKASIVYFGQSNIQGHSRLFILALVKRGYAEYIVIESTAIRPFSTIAE